LDPQRELQLPRIWRHVGNARDLFVMILSPKPPKGTPLDLEVKKKRILSLLLIIPIILFAWLISMKNRGSFP
jgi:hypothetical protein